MASINPAYVTSAFELPGHRTQRNLGPVRGIIVRSRSVIGNFIGGLQTIFGGNITVYTDLCEHTRQEAFERMCTHAHEIGANAIVGMRYDATGISLNLSEVLCYGTAIIVEAITS